jgi:hypothetical protein
MVPISRRNRSAAPVSPVMSMPASDPVKMRPARDWVVAVIVTSAGAGGGLAVTDRKLLLALVPTVTVPLLLALHATSVITLARAPGRAPSAAGPLIPGVASA